MSVEESIIPLQTPAELGDPELLAIALGRSLPSAARLLAELGGLGGLARLPVDELLLRRVSPRRALGLHAALELGRRSVAAPLVRGQTLADAHTVARVLRARLAVREQEEFHVVGVDARQRLVVHFVAALGNAAEVRVDPRDVFRPLVRANAAGAIVAHNHPSGDAAPSDADRALTERLAEAGEVVGVRLVDHLVVAASGHFSFAAAGVL